jgi:hypothetical protein
MSNCEFILPNFYPKQKELVCSTEKFVCCIASPQVGKTAALLAYCIKEALTFGKGKTIWWVAPESSVALIAWRRLVEQLQFNLPQSMYTINVQYKYIDIHDHARIKFITAESNTGLYGETCDLIVIDECGLCTRKSYDAILARTTKTDAPIRCASNLHGRNWYWEMCQGIKNNPTPDEKYIEINIDDAIEAGFINPKTIVRMKKQMTQSRFNELYYCIPSDDAQNPFGLDHINSCIIDTPDTQLPIVSYGVDLGRLQDWTVILGLSRDSNLDYVVSKLERTQASWQLIKGMIGSLVDNSSTYTPVCIDSTGLGDPIVSDLERTMDNLCPYKISMKSKTILIESLIMAIQSHHLKIPRNYSILIDELKNFGQERLSDNSSYISYKALGNGHDDCVIALALAYYIAQKNLGNCSLLPMLIDSNFNNNNIFNNDGWTNLNGQDDNDSMYY